MADLPDCLRIGEECNVGDADDISCLSCRHADLEDIHVVVDGVTVLPDKKLELLGVKFDSSFSTFPHGASVAASARQQAAMIGGEVVPHGDFVVHQGVGFVGKMQRDNSSSLRPGRPRCDVGGEENLAKGVPRVIRPILTVEGLHVAKAPRSMATAWTVNARTSVMFQIVVEHSYNSQTYNNIYAITTKRRNANHPCPVCGKFYVNEGSLRKHLTCHPEMAGQISSTLRMWPCSVCTAVFTHEN
eukprot:maker-scaffold775_size99154-snap-gene-0.19 protein:Tk07860 transcript:maker-scaffold775_size99154-snap-gene-0.19-mRNA-1 annotation:"hypothetical protein EAI_09524"